jgi:hypothetical protein
VLKWSLERGVPIWGSASRHVRRIIEDLEREGML